MGGNPQIFLYRILKSSLTAAFELEEWMRYKQPFTTLLFPTRFGILLTVRIYPESVSTDLKTWKQEPPCGLIVKINILL